MSENCPKNDLSGKKIAWLIWGLPMALLLIGVFWSRTRVWLWAPALVVAGVACLVNANRCGRLHCYFTGPLYLLAALATVLVGLEWVALRWSWIAIGLVGGTALAIIPEWVRGKYVNLSRSC